MLKAEVELQNKQKAVAFVVFIVLFRTTATICLSLSLSHYFVSLNSQMSRFSGFGTHVLLSDCFRSPRHSCHTDRSDIWTKYIFNRRPSPSTRSALFPYRFVLQLH